MMIGLHLGDITTEMFGIWEHSHLENMVLYEK